MKVGLLNLNVEGNLEEESDLKEEGYDLEESDLDLGEEGDVEEEE